MDIVNNYSSQFSEKEVEHIFRIRKKYFEAPLHLIGVKDKISLEPYSIGLPIGEDTKKGFKPSLYLLEKLSESSKNKVFVNEKAEWLFLCRRDALERSILKDESENDVFLVQNERDENLGVGRKARQGKSFIVKNVFERGDFLGREK